MKLIDMKVAITLNPVRERYEAICPACEQTLFFVSQKSIKEVGRPLPEYIPHLCNEETR